MANAALLQRSVNINAELTALVTATESLPRGSFVSHEDIGKASGIVHGSKHYNRLIKFWKRAMLSRGIYIEAAVPLGTGYRFATIEEQKERIPRKLEKQADKRLVKAASCLGSIREDELDETGKRFVTARLGQLADRKKIAQEHQAQAASWLSNPATLPRLNGNGKALK